MPRLVRSRRRKLGLPPGAIVHVGERRSEQVTLSVMDYDPEHVQARTLPRVEEAFPYRDTATVTWINVAGLHDVEVVHRLGEHYGIHPLVLEDILHTEQRPKVEVFDDYIYVVLKMLRQPEGSEELEAQQVSVILGETYVITFLEQAGDLFDPVRARLEQGQARLRRSGPEYLAHALLDVIVDHYFVILERIGEQIEELEARVLGVSGEPLVHVIQHLKRELIFLRRSLWPLRDLLSTLTRQEHPLLERGVVPYLSDLHDHAIQVIDMVETFRDLLSGVLDVYLSAISNRMNEVMKVLTVIATVFIPLTFLAGIYGMNFDTMPELHFRWGYPAFWGVCVLLAGGMVLYFRRKRWL